MGFLGHDSWFASSHAQKKWLKQKLKYCLNGCSFFLRCYVLPTWYHKPSRKPKKELTVKKRIGRPSPMRSTWCAIVFSTYDKNSRSKPFSSIVRPKAHITKTQEFKNIMKPDVVHHLYCNTETTNFAPLNCCPVWYQRGEYGRQYCWHLLCQDRFSLLIILLSRMSQFSFITMLKMDMI